MSYRNLVYKYGFTKAENLRPLGRVPLLDSGNAAPRDLLPAYQIYSQRAAEDPQSECKLRLEMVLLFDAETSRLNSLKTSQDAMDKHREANQASAALVPPQDVLERLLRYETHLSREFDRTLSQLERLQRIRLGHPVPGTINVNLSSS